MSIEENVKDWNEGKRIVVTCKKCNYSIHSVYSGQFLFCKCGEVFVDQTDCYCRIGGDREHYTTKVEILYPEEVKDE